MSEDVKKLTDKERIDFLESLSGEYTGLVVLRMSSMKRGWRLHETSGPGAVKGVRDAIDNYYTSHDNKEEK